MAYRVRLNKKSQLLANDTSIFFATNDIDVSADQMNKDFERISIWAYQWKMCFNPDSSHLTLYINKTGCLYKNIQLSIYIIEKVSNTIKK